MQGRFDAADDVVALVKQYVGAHALEYRGILAGRALRGRWRIPDRLDTGLFAFWHADTLEADVRRKGTGRARKMWPPLRIAAELVAPYASPLRPSRVTRHLDLLSRFDQLAPAGA
jgi:hypothetical protein